jgi:C-terminal processing protease CtpA/Prc
MVQRPEPSLLGLSRTFRRAPYGHKLLEDSRALYVWYDTCADAGDAKVSTFCEDALRALDAGLAANPPAIERVVIDLRRNGGGNSLLFAPMIEGLARREGINQKGKLYALIGRRTFSSAMMNAYQLTSATKCLLVGEPTGGTPNGYGEVKQFRLPNSKLVVQYSTKLFKGPKPGDAVMPDIAADADAASYFDPKRDAVLEAAIGHRPV